MTPLIAFALAIGAFYLGAPVYGVLFLVCGMLASIDA
jgi:hypothetical protein